MKNIVLIGLMGCGKSTIGRCLGEELQREVIDIDDVIVMRFQKTIPELFAVSEDHFRDCEAICVKDAAKKEDLIIATGGGVIKRPDNITALKKNGFIIYLDRPVELIVSDVDIDGRPLLKEGAARLYELYQERHESYLSACDVHLINDLSLDEIINQIKKVINES